MLRQLKKIKDAVRGSPHTPCAGARRCLCAVSVLCLWCRPAKGAWTGYHAARRRRLPHTRTAALCGAVSVHTPLPAPQRRAPPCAMSATHTTSVCACCVPAAGACVPTAVPAPRGGAGRAYPRSQHRPDHLLPLSAGVQQLCVVPRRHHTASSLPYRVLAGGVVEDGVYRCVQSRASGRVLVAAHSCCGAGCFGGCR